MKRRIGFDLDGTLYGWHQLIYDYLVKENMVDVNYTYFWGHYKYFEYLIKPLLKEKYFYQAGEPYYKSVETLNKYAQDNSLAYITQRPLNVASVTENWLKLWEFPQAYNFRILEDKVSYITTHNFDYYVEDRSEYIEAMYDYTQVIGVRQPWNEEYFLNSANKQILWINSIRELPTVLEI
jgi:uncharacterized HAD superfamily protein